MAYSFTVSYIILYLMNLVPFLKLRVEERWEIEGLDHCSMGEYTFESLTTKEARLNLEDYFGSAVQDVNGNVVSKE
jgi:ammonium transporter, Amt family